MLNNYPKFEKGRQGGSPIEFFYNSLPKKEQDIISQYLKYRTARAKYGSMTAETLADIKRYVLHIRYVTEKPFSKLTLNDIINFLVLLNNSYMGDYARNNIKINLRNFLKWHFKDWSARFNNLEDIRLISKPANKNKMSSADMLTEIDIENILKHESRLFYKTFFLVQFEAGLRTIETRLLKWADLKLSIDGDISEVNIYATKTKRSRPVFVKKATGYLHLLKQEQERLGTIGVYVFHSKGDINKPIDKSTISLWMRGLSDKVGRNMWNYLLRHSRATMLYKLAREGKISKDTAADFMGHSKDMSQAYEHLDEETLKAILKNQIYQTEELPPDKKTELEEKVNSLTDQFNNLKDFQDISLDFIKTMLIELDKQGVRMNDPAKGIELKKKWAKMNEKIESTKINIKKKNQS
ncbi:MAG: site-specific integrase [Elusimicrobia bacterium]|nr:site-specific integrase [Candidatus Liberimonas magnetica]